MVARLAFGKETELAEMDRFNLSHYELRDFKLRPVGNDGAVMTYTAEYSGTYGHEPLQMKAIYGWLSKTFQGGLVFKRLVWLICKKEGRVYDRERYTENL
jgi:hypothetical protein